MNTSTLSLVPSPALFSPEHEHAPEAITVRAVASVPPALRRVRQTIIREALAVGRSVDADALDAVLLVKHQRPESFTWWTPDIVWEILWVDAAEWCQRQGAVLPLRIPETFWFVLGELQRQGLVDPECEPLTELREPLLSSGGLTKAGRPRVKRHPASW